MKRLFLLLLLLHRRRRSHNSWRKKRLFLLLLLLHRRRRSHNSWRKKRLFLLLLLWRRRLRRLGLLLHRPRAEALLFLLVLTSMIVTIIVLLVLLLCLAEREPLHERFEASRDDSVEHGTIWPLALVEHHLGSQAPSSFLDERAHIGSHRRRRCRRRGQNTSEKKDGATKKNVNAKINELHIYFFFFGSTRLGSTGDRGTGGAVVIGEDGARGHRRRRAGR